MSSSSVIVTEYQIITAVIDIISFDPANVLLSIPQDGGTIENDVGEFLGWVTQFTIGLDFTVRDL